MRLVEWASEYNHPAKRLSDYGDSVDDDGGNNPTTLFVSRIEMAHHHYQSAYHSIKLSPRAIRESINDAQGIIASYFVGPAHVPGRHNQTFANFSKDLKNGLWPIMRNAEAEEKGQAEAEEGKREAQA